MKRVYKLWLDLARRDIEGAADFLRQIYDEAEPYYATQEAGWQEGADGHAYSRAMGELREAAETLRTFALPDIEVLR